MRLVKNEQKHSTAKNKADGIKFKIKIYATNATATFDAGSLKTLEGKFKMTIYSTEILLNKQII